MPSRIEVYQYYTIDMSIGVCECPVGFDGSPCTHQFLIWVENLADSVNFILIFNKEEHQRWARIAFGTALPLTYYKGLLKSSSNLHKRSLTIKRSVMDFCVFCWTYNLC